MADAMIKYEGGTGSKTNNKPKTIGEQIRDWWNDKIVPAAQAASQKLSGTYNATTDPKSNWYGAESVPNTSPGFGLPGMTNPNGNGAQNVLQNASSNGSLSGAISSPSSAVTQGNGLANQSVSIGYDKAYYDLLKGISDSNNQFNLDQVKMVNEYNALEAQKNRDWQERLSNTAHQREIKDLIAAGLNPVISAGGQGAITGSGAVASGQKAVADNILGQGMQSILVAGINAASAQKVAEINASAKVAAASMSSSASGYAARLNYASQANYQQILRENNRNSNITGIAKTLISALLR